MAAREIRVTVHTEDGSTYGLGLSLDNHPKEQHPTMLEYLFQAAINKQNLNYRVVLVKRDEPLPFNRE